MTQSRITVNLKVNKVGDWGAAIEYFKRLDPVFLVACIDTKNDSPRIYELQKALPNTKIIARYIIIVKNEDGSEKELDGGMHLAPQAVNDKRRYVVSPGDFLNEWGYLGTNGLSLYCINEPQASDANDEDIQRLVQWSIEVIGLATQRGISLTWGNFGVGHPVLLENGQYDARFDDVLSLLSKQREIHSLGIHAYMPMDIDGRLSGMIARCKAIGITPPKTYITEFNYDTAFAGDPLSGHLSRGYSGDQFANREIDVLTNVYQPYIADGTLEGFATFEYAILDAKWAKAFNVEEKSWKTTILAAKDAGKLTIDKRNTQTIPIIKPNYTPAEFVANARYQLVIAGTYRNLRKAPSVATGEFIGQVNNNETVTALEQTIIGVDYWWKVSTDTLTGWISLDGGRVELRRVVDTPAPLPTQPPQPPPPSVPYPEVSAFYARDMAKVYHSLATSQRLMADDSDKVADQWAKLADVIEGKAA